MANTAYSKLQQLIWIILIGFIAWKYRNKYKTRVCDPNDRKCADEYFSDNYTESRDKFLKYSNKIKNANTYNIPIYTDNEQVLYTDITILNENSDSNHLILHLSGVHGVEGYTGSAIQLSLLDHIANPKKNNKFGSLYVDEDSQPIIIFVHAVNPYGFHKTRRQNEENIDLNRNFKTTDEWDQFLKTGPNAFHYQDLSDFLNPKYNLKEFGSFLFDYKIPTKYHKYLINVFHFFNMVLPAVKMPYYLYKFGWQKMKVAGMVGQMYDPNGIQYVGNGTLAKSHRELKQFLSNKFNQQTKWKSQIDKITMIDVHTGDHSSYGIDKLLTNKMEYAMKLKRLFLDYDEHDLIQSLDSKKNKNDPQYLDGIYDNVNGFTFAYAPFLASLINNELNDDKKEIDLLAFTSEFGTNNIMVILGLASVMENAYFQEYNEYIKQENVDPGILYTMEIFLNKASEWFKDCFYVQEPKWKKIVVQRGFRVFNGCLIR